MDASSEAAIATETTTDANNIAEQQIDVSNKDSGSQSESDKIDDAAVSNAARTTEGQTFPDEYAKHIEYNTKGQPIYTDPSTKSKYEFDIGVNQWVPIKSTDENDTAQSNPYENEHYRWCHETNQWILKDQSASSATTATENEFYKWNDEKKQWVPKTTGHDSITKFENGVHTYTDGDGAVFFWDTEKNAWFPRIDDDFLAVYQMSYGFVDNTSSSGNDDGDGDGGRTAPADQESQTIEPTATSEANSNKDKKAGGKREAPSNYI